VGRPRKTGDPVEGDLERAGSGQDGFVKLLEDSSSVVPETAGLIRMSKQKIRYDEEVRIGFGRSRQDGSGMVANV
jgi:hypothetical protein